MFDQVTALQEQLNPSRGGKPGPAGVTLSLLSGFTLTQIAGWPGTLTEAGAAAASTAGCAAAPGPGRIEQGAAGTLLRVEPLKWWLIQGAGLQSTPLQTVNGGTVLDLSSARTLVQVSGPQAETLLNHFLPLDLRPAAFPDGAVASTSFHHVGVTLWRSGALFTLALPQSFAASLWELLAGSALQYGLKTRETAFSPVTGDLK
ncbi:MAG: sarcosine oxidase subunit gamma [Leisingera sp.]